MYDRRSFLAPLCFAAMTIAAAPAMAQTVATQMPHLSVELNALTPAPSGCQISFVIQNDHGADINHAVFEAVLFDTENRVDRLTLFDFGALPAARPRVRQFIVPDLTCESLGRILINGAPTCAAPDLPESACMLDLSLTSRTKVELIG